MTTDKIKQMLTYRWLIFTILALAYFFVYFHRLSLSVVADTLVKEFNTTAGVMGLLGSVYFYCYAILQFPAGLLSDSIGPRKTVTFFLLIASIGSLLFGFASNIQMAFFGRVLVGVGVSMVFIPTMKILSQWFGKKEFAFMAGILNAIGGGGVLAATWLLALMTISLGWRLSFELIGICTIVIVVFNWLIVRDHPFDKGWPSIAEVKDNATPTDATKPISLMAGARQVVSEKYFWPIALWFFFDCGIFFGFGALWGGPYLMHVYQMTRAETGIILSMIAWGMIIGSPALGIISDRWVKSRKKPLIFCSLVLSLLLLILYLVPAGIPKPLLFVVFFILSLCSSAVVVIGFTTTKELFPVAIAGTSVGTVNLFPFLGGAVYMPFLGKVLDAYPQSNSGAYSLEGYTMMLLILFLSAMGVVICSCLMKETYKND